MEGIQKNQDAINSDLDAKIEQLKMQRKKKIDSQTQITEKHKEFINIADH